MIGSSSRERLPVVLFAMAAFANAVLLFSVEPMFAKLLLPQLGGAPSVWNTSLVFFQAVLLAGYAYAHLTTRLLSPQRQVAVHIALLLLSLLALPLQLRLPGAPPSGDAAIPWLVLALTLSLAFPFMTLASGAPLLQRWFAATDHEKAGNPYFLYSASNLGSLVALVSYPLVMEPWLTLRAQRTAWSWGYVVVMVVIAACALWSARRPASNASLDAAPGATTAGAAPTTRDKLRWVVYSAVPSSLLLGVTTFVSTDLAAVPLLWVVPLAIYLLTFVLAFAARPLPRASILRIEPYFLILVALQHYWSASLPGLAGVAFHFVLFFVVAMVCHGELSHLRPPAPRLTEFFVWISIGGLLGGVFNALVAPLVFNEVIEYPVVLALAGFLRPAPSSLEFRGTPSASRADLLVPVALLLLLALAPQSIDIPPHGNLVTAVVVMSAVGIILLRASTRPRRFGLALSAIVCAALLRDTLSPGGLNLRTERSFFGVYRVRESTERGVRELIHGTTLHGAQSLSPERRLDPLTYYHRAGPMGDLFGVAPAATAHGSRVGVIGLGVGSLACYGRADSRWTFFEIDPVVLDIARDRRLFTFLSDCPANADVVLGDARLGIARADAASYDVLVLDAFSSDAIPVHLLTREAFALYDRVLAPRGILAVHISNRHLDLEPVVAAIVKDASHLARVRADRMIPRQQAAEGRAAAVWILVVRNPADLGAIAADPRWKPLRSGADLWTDDFSNVLRVLR